MRDQDCVRFLQLHLPRLGLKWSGYRKVRRTVCKRIRRRMRMLGLLELAAYGRLLDESPEELARFDAYCRIPISRFFRDRGVFEALGATLLPHLAHRVAARGERAVRCWSAGCASGEEVFSLRLLWDLSPDPAYLKMRLIILGTDADEIMLRRAELACYSPGSFRDTPDDMVERAFEATGGLLCLRPAFRHDIEFRREDIRERQPDGPFDLIVCRNLVFTYFADDLQRRTLRQLAQRLLPGGLLMLGTHERLPTPAEAFVRTSDALPIWCKSELA